MFNFEGGGEGGAKILLYAEADALAVSPPLVKVLRELWNDLSDPYTL